MQSSEDGVASYVTGQMSIEEAAKDAGNEEVLLV